jgi:hypothetical protein
MPTCGQQNAQIKVPEFTIDPLQPVFQLDIGVNIERGGFGSGKRERWPLHVFAHVRRK